jgi:uncharacterized protein
MLRLMLDTIEEGTNSLDLKCSPKELDLEFDGTQFIGDVSISLRLYRQISKIFVKASMSVDAEMECSRCLIPVPMKIEATTEIQYSPLPKFERDQIDAIGIGYYSEEYIELSDELRESILLELPMIVLCSEDCIGFCPHCGKNLNIEVCDCSEIEEISDLKLAVLDKLLEIKGKLEV